MRFDFLCSGVSCREDRFTSLKYACFQHNNKDFRPDSQVRMLLKLINNIKRK